MDHFLQQRSLVKLQFFSTVHHQAGPSRWFAVLLDANEACPCSTRSPSHLAGPVRLDLSEMACKKCCWRWSKCQAWGIDWKRIILHLFPLDIDHRHVCKLCLLKDSKPWQMHMHQRGDDPSLQWTLGSNDRPWDIVLQNFYLIANSHGWRWLGLAVHLWGAKMGLVVCWPFQWLSIRVLKELPPKWNECMWFFHMWT